MRLTLIGLTHPYRGGIAHFTTSLYRALKEDHEVQLISFSRLYPSILFPGTTQFDASRETFTALPEGWIDALNPFTWFGVYRAIKKSRPDRVIFMWWSPATSFCYAAISLLCRRSGIPCIFYCHNVLPHENGFLARLLSRMGLKSAGGFIANASSDADLLRQLFPRKSVVRGFHPVYEIFPETSLRPEQARSQLGISRPMMLFFGHVRKYKGLGVLLEAFSKVVSRVDCMLVIAGEFYEGKEEYARMIRSLGLQDRVLVMDRYIPNEEVAVLFSASDVVVLPYRSASQSGVAQLAYHFGRPVITTRVGGLPDVVREGETGFMVEPDDPQALGDAIAEFFKAGDPSRFHENIKQTREHYSWKKLAQIVATSKGET